MLAPPNRLMRSAMRHWLHQWLGYECDACRTRSDAARKKTPCNHLPPAQFLAAPAMASTKGDFVLGDPLTPCVNPVCNKPRR